MSGKKKVKEHGSMLLGEPSKEEAELAAVLRDELLKRGIECVDLKVETRTIRPENNPNSFRVFSMLAKPMLGMPIEVTIDAVKHTMGGIGSYADLVERALLRDLAKMIEKSTLNPEKAFKRERRVAEVFGYV